MDRGVTPKPRHNGQMIDWNIVWRDFVGISWSGALGVIASSVVLYLFFTLLIHLSGPRLMANPTVGSFVVLAVIGGVTARATLGEATTMLGALIVLNTLMVMEYLMGSIRGARRLTTRRRPLVVMVEGRPLLGALRRRHLTPQELLSRLRVNGVKDPCELELVILEIRGSLTIVRRGATIGRSLVADVEGRELIPQRLLTTGAAEDHTN